MIRELKELKEKYERVNMDQHDKILSDKQNIQNMATERGLCPEPLQARYYEYQRVHILIIVL